MTGFARSEQKPASRHDRSKVPVSLYWVAPVWIESIAGLAGASLAFRLLETKAIQVIGFKLSESVRLHNILGSLEKNYEED